ncbi:MAG: prepilin-type N-terminal cleavage/methylation domain-containing protein, partial [Synergistaceae bacterium]|nr:prepilin-type N-terminal cleavage/methylation domain-containing protein [Synergistaceae bacterium]
MRKGISLIEILIVIAVIVILSSGVMLSITSMEASAQANKIINDLVNIKMAALLWYKNNADTAIINLGDKNKEQVKYNGIQGWVQKVNQNNGKGDGLGLSKYLDSGK